MTVRYTAMHCNTLHYTVENTAAHCSSANKTRPNQVVGLWSGCCSPKHTATKKCC